MHKEHFNHEFYNDGADDLPEGTGDRFWAIDLVRDFQYQRQMAGLLAFDLVKKEGRGIIVYKPIGAISFASYTTITITGTWSGYVLQDVEVPDDTTIFQIPQDKKTVTIPVRIEIPTVTNQNLAAIGFVADGSVQYMKARYLATSVQSRTRQFATGTYNYNRSDSYELYIDAVAPTEYDIWIADVWGDGSSYLHGQEKTRDNVTGMTNPNLCVNGSFQIDQRFGDNAYDATGSYMLCDTIKRICDGTFIENHGQPNTGNDYRPRAYLTVPAGGQTYSQVQIWVENLRQFSSKTMSITLNHGYESAYGPDLLLKNTIRISTGYGTGGSPSAGSFFTVGRISRTGINKFTFQFPDVMTGKTYGTDGLHTSYIVIHLDNTINTAGYVMLISFKLEISEVPTEHVQLPFAEDLQKCMRYYQKTYPYLILPGTETGAALNIEDFTVFLEGQAYMLKKCQFQVPMRVYPTLSIYDHLGTVNSLLYCDQLAAARIGVPTAVDNLGDKGFRLYFADPFNGISRILFHWVADASF